MSRSPSTSITFSSGANGLILIFDQANFITSSDPAFDPATTLVADTDFAGGGLQNDDNSFLLIFSPTPITTSTKLDPSHTGTMTLPSVCAIVDGIGWTSGAAGNFVYGGTTLPLPAGVASTDMPDAAIRASLTTPRRIPLRPGITV